MEVVDLSTTKYPNRDALRDANDIYLDYMRPFIINHLKQVPGEKVEDLIEKALTDDQLYEFQRVLDETDDIESAIDFSYFPLIVRDNWIIPRNNRKYGFAQWFDRDMTVQNMLWLIKDGRNACEHRGTKDLNSEFVRMNLFLIAEVLGKINRPDEQCEVEDIRDNLFADDTAERLEKLEKENADYKRSLAEAEQHLATVESEKSKYAKKNAALSKEIDEKEKQRKKLDRQLKKAKAQNDKYKKDITGAKQRLEESEAAHAAYKARCETTDERLKETESELTIVSGPKPNVVDKFREANDLEARKEIGREVAKLRINATGSKPLAWRKIREKLGLKNDEFHKVVRLEEHFRESVVERIESFEDGWECQGKLDRLLGFEPVGELASRIEACKPRNRRRK